MGVGFWPQLDLGVRVEQAQQVASVFLASEGWTVRVQAVTGTSVDLVGKQTRDVFHCCALRRVTVRLRPRGNTCIAEVRFGLGLFHATILGIITTTPAIVAGLAFALDGIRPLPLFAAALCSMLVLVYWQKRPTCEELLLKYAAAIHTKAGSIPRYQTTGALLQPNPILLFTGIVTTVSITTLAIAADRATASLLNTLLPLSLLMLLLVMVAMGITPQGRRRFRFHTPSSGRRYAPSPSTNVPTDARNDPAPVQQSRIGSRAHQRVLVIR